jgi:solute carrier family 25 (mitochondrial S-adenosylmethionine transporter), member 26
MDGRTYACCLASGGFAGTMTDVALFPLDTVKTRLMAAGGFAKNGGFQGLYRGLAASTLASAPCAAVFFSTYELARHHSLRLLPSEHLHPFAYMFAASCGEACAAVVRVPFEIAKQQKQVSASHGQSSLSLLSEYVAANRARGLFNAYKSLVAREIPFSLLQFPMYEAFKQLLRQQRQFPSLRTPQEDGGDLTLVAMAACGSVSGSIAAALTTPMDVVKTRIMVNEGNKGVLETIKHVYNSQGLSGLYAGVSYRVAWIGLGGAFFFGSYEAAKRYLMRSTA